MKKETVLAKNIRYLRKSQKLSQEELANKLGIKRSNIAAYESKNVEPRLRIILELARLFNVSVKSLIDQEISDVASVAKFEQDVFQNEQASARSLDITDTEEVNEFVTKSEKIRKVLEGFKAFYTFKKNNLKEQSADQSKLIFDIDNFIMLMEHLLAYNETVIKAISTEKQVS